MKKVLVTMGLLGLIVQPALANCNSCCEQGCSLHPSLNNNYARGAQIYRPDSKKYSITGAAVQISPCECPESFPVAYECFGGCALKAPVHYEYKKNKSWTRYFW